MRQMTLDQIDLEGNGFHEALNAFIIFHTMESLGKLKSTGAASQCTNMKGNYTVKSKCCIIAHCYYTLLLFVVNLVNVTSTGLLYLNT